MIKRGAAGIESAEINDSDTTGMPVWLRSRLAKPPSTGMLRVSGCERATYLGDKWYGRQL